MIYELRKYVAANGKINELHNRFEKHVLSLFKKNRITIVGFWTHCDDPNTIIYLCRFQNENAKNQAWAAFKKDSEWKRIKSETEKDGPLTNVMESKALIPVNYTSQP